MEFSTYDKDNDISNEENCAVVNYGAWWYKDCQSTKSNLNGRFRHEGTKDGMTWYDLTQAYSVLRRSKMMIRPRDEE